MRQGTRLVSYPLIQFCKPDEKAVSSNYVANVVLRGVGMGDVSLSLHLIVSVVSGVSLLLSL